MARSAFKLTRSATNPDNIPEQFSEAVALLVDLTRRGIVAEIAERARIRRQGGYPGVDVVLLLLVLFASDRLQGIRPAWSALGPCAQRLARLAGRKALPSPPSVSRALAKVEPALTRPMQHWLLGEASGIDDVIRHPSTSFIDPTGAAWEVFDLDPTVTTLRHRGLPRSEELPEPTLRSEDTGAPGFPGRKRGDMQFRRTTVQHAGSGAWVHAHASAGNGDGVADLELALSALGATCQRLGLTRERTLVRLDGEYGTAPSIAALRRHQQPFVVRLNRPELYEDAALLARLDRGRWHPVDDGLSGPRRYAVEADTVVLPDGNGGLLAPLRVVASVYEDVTGRGRGKTIDGYRVELFGVDVHADAWPAPDAVTAYFGRAAQENRFGQEDRELGLDRIFSYHLPGQEFACIVGLALWNLRIARGFEAEPPPAESPKPRPRPAQPTWTPPPGWPRDPKLAKLLDRISWQEAMANRPGWSWSSEAGAPCCPEGLPLDVSCVPNAGIHDRHTIVFRLRHGECDDCPQRVTCLRSERPHVSKQIQLAAPYGMAVAARSRLVELRAARAADALPAPPAQMAVATPLFLPAEARRLQRERFVGMRASIRIETPQPPARPRLLARDERARQHRRKNWTERVQDFAAPDGSQVWLHVECSDAADTFMRSGGANRAARRAPPGAGRSAPERACRT